MERARWTEGALLLCSLLCSRLDAQTAPTTTRVEVEVPGGLAAVARVVEQVDEDPDRFVDSLNAQLLTATRVDHDWREIPKRLSLSRFLELVAEIEQRFPSPIALGAGKEELRTTTRLADLLGFALVEDPRRGFLLAPKNEGDVEQAFRRAVAQALGFEVEEWSARLNEGDSWSLTVPRDRAVSPVSTELWRHLTDLPLGADALATLAHDQRTSLLIEGRARVSRETRDALDGMDLRRIRDRAAFAFRRYAPAIAIERGRLQAPGGDAAREEWRALTGASNDSSESLLHALLETRRAKGAYLWHALHFAPEAAVDYFVGRRDGAGTSLLRRVFDRLDESSGTYDTVQAGEPGLAALARSLPFAGTPPSLPLPGGPGLWRKALDGDAPPHTLAQLRSVLGSQSPPPLDEESLLLQVMSDTAPDASATMLPRLLRGIDFFERHPAIYSPENVLLVVRGSTTFAPALAALDDLEPRSADLARDYLLAVSHLERLDLDWPREQLVIAFEGGIEWLRAMAIAGRVDREVVERELLAWIAIHTRHDDTAAAAPDQLRWLTRLLRALPPAPDTAPGRGPLERALLQAVVAPTEPGLVWMGLDYDSERTQRLAAGMADALDFFSIPEADRLVRIDDTLEELALRAREQDLEGAKTAAKALRADLAALEAHSPAAANARGVLPRVTSNPQRDGIAALAADVLGQKRAQGLAGLEPRVTDSRRQLAADLRPLLAAPRYLIALADGRGSLLQDRDLIRKHRLVCASPVEDRAWSEATLERGDEDAPGAWLCGHVAAVEGALSSFTFSTTELRTGRGLDPRRSQAWFRYWIKTRWDRMRPAATSALAATLDAGLALLEHAARDAAQGSGGPSVELAASIVPRARLERAGESPPHALVSPAEALMAGLAALERPAGDPALTSAAAELARARAAIAELGTDWRAQLAAVGPASPTANGRSGPTLGWWPSFEGIALDDSNQALVERELVDLHLQVVAFVGRHRLPGFVASDVMRRTMEDLSSTVDLGHERDWESVLRKLRGLDDAYFETRLRECLRLGFYRLREL